MQKACFHDSVKPLAPEQGGDWWAVFFEDVPVGFASLRPSSQWQNTGYLSRAGILDGHRGHGLQRRFIKVRERWARRLGYDWLVTDTWQNHASANNLASCGFRMYTPSTPWAAKGTLYWRKKV
jgi:GNAT superfamily N-acetyltransferase